MYIHSLVIHSIVVIHHPSSIHPSLIFDFSLYLSGGSREHLASPSLSQGDLTEDARSRRRRRHQRARAARAVVAAEMKSRRRQLPTTGVSMQPGSTSYMCVRVHARASNITKERGRRACVV